MITTEPMVKIAPPSLKHISMPEGEQAPFIAVVSCHVQIHGIIAEVTKTLTIFNPNQRDLESELLLPLPEKSILCSHSLDMDGRMRKGVIVSKQRGRQILESEIRKNVDPGLVEKVEGNIHRIRIYPLPSLGWRTVSVTWLTELSLSDATPWFHLPMGYLQKVSESALKVEIYSDEESPVIYGGQTDLHFKKVQQVWTAETKMNRGQHVDDLKIILPASSSHAPIASFEEHGPGARFFSLNCAIPDPEESAKQWQPKRISILWDASGSCSDKQKELELLALLITRWRNIILDCILFRDSVEEEDQCSFTITDGQGDLLLQWLKATAYDGSTNLSALDLDTLFHPDAEACFLFSDGLTTLGRQQELHSPVPLHSFCSQAMANTSFLAHSARVNGGHFYNFLKKGSAGITEQLMLNRPVLRIINSAGCEAIHLQEQGDRLSIVGRLTAGKTSIDLAHGKQSLQYTFSTSSAKAGKNIAKVWASREAEKYFFLDEQSEIITSLGREYGLVTSTTSLLVLENVAQYLEHDVEPPKEDKELYETYQKLRHGRRKDLQKTRQEHLDSINILWKDLISWWEKDFTVRKQRNLATARRSDEMFGSAIDSVGDFGGMAYGGTEILCCRAEPDASSERSESATDETSEQSEPADRNKNIISLQEWSPDSAYLKELASCAKKDRYRFYLSQRQKHSKSPSFFLDCGDFFLKKGSYRLGVRILGNLLEISMGSPVLLRTYAYRLLQGGELDRAIEVFSTVLSVRDDEPQSHRDLSLALAERWQRDRQEADLFTAMLLLWSVVEEEWERFPEIELIALQELNRLIWLAEKNSIAIPERIEQRFRKRLDLDLRVTLAWDADLTDVDLHIYEPDGSHAYYGDKYSPQGARVSRDVTDGYGPEEYILRKAEKGSYGIKVHYFASHQQTICGPCTVTATLYTDYARENEQKQTMVLRLGKSGEDFSVGEIEI